MGIYNAGRFLALVIGSAVGGVVAAHWGYQEVIGVGLGFLLLGLALNLVLIAWLERGEDRKS
jgi:predicted MFS family arabinose efflux permease